MNSKKRKVLTIVERFSAELKSNNNFLKLRKKILIKKKQITVSNIFQLRLNNQLLLVNKRLVNAIEEMVKILINSLVVVSKFKSQEFISKISKCWLSYI